MIANHSIIFGLAEPKPAKGFPDGRIRWRLRNDEFALARVKTSDGIREFYVKEEDGFWMPVFEQGRNSNADMALGDNRGEFSFQQVACGGELITERHYNKSTLSYGNYMRVKNTST